MPSLAIELLSGVGYGDFSVHVVDGGREIDLFITWPKGLWDLKSLHNKFLMGPTELELYHPKYIGFVTSRKSYRFTRIKGGPIYI